MFRLPNIEMSLPVGLILFFVLMIAGAWVGSVVQDGILESRRFSDHTQVRALHRHGWEPHECASQRDMTRR